MTRLYREDTDRLGLGRPDAEPLATETMPEIVDLIEALIERGHAYESGGDVYFRVRSQPGYGKLSNRDPDEMDQGEEAGSASLKEDRARLRAVEGPQGGRGHLAGPRLGGRAAPGWHIECSAMAEKLLGTDFAIHGGGLDLVFPHHENEIAQTEAGRASRWRGCGCTTGCSAGDGEDVEVRGQHLRPRRGPRRPRPRGGGRVPRLRPLPPAPGVLRPGPRGGRGAGRAGAQLPAGRVRQAGRGPKPRGPLRRGAPGGVPRGAGRRLQHPAWPSRRCSS